MTEADGVLVLADRAAWRAWLDDHESSSDGVWLRIAKRGTTSPTALLVTEALDEALCSGWIDGQRRAFDDATFLQRYTPRRRASLWSQRNIGLVEALIAAGRMRDRGHAEIARAKADGRWERAYAGAATATVPVDLLAALAAAPAAAELFAALNGTNRYACIHRVVTAATPATRAARIARLVEMLARGGTPYPQRRPADASAPDPAGEAAAADVAAADAGAER